MRQMNTCMRLGASQLAILMGMAVQPALAQEQVPDTSGGIQEIVVTAQKRAESLQKVPIAITALDQRALEQKGINTLQDFVNTPPPGLAVQSFAGANQAIIIDIRGISNTDPTQGTVELGVAIYQDDVYLGRAQGLGTDLADPERIEVLRGPQGTLFGRNAEGGAVRIVTSKPTGEFGGRVKAGFGNYGQQRYEAHVNLPEIYGFLVKFDYLKTMLDGYTRNGTARVPQLARQGRFGASDSEGWRASVRWKPIEAVTVDYSYDNGKSSSFGDWFVRQVPNPTPPLYNPGGVHFDGTFPPNESVRNRTDLVKAQFNEPFVTKTSGHTLTAAYDLTDEIAVKSISSWRKVRSEGSQQLGGSFSLVPFEFTPGFAPNPISSSILTPDPKYGSLGTIAPGTPVYAASGVIPYANLRQSQFSQEVQLLGSTDTIQWVVGGYFYRERVSDSRRSFFSGVFLDTATDGSYTNFVPTNPFSLPFPGQGLGVNLAKSRSYAAFAQLTWSPEFAGERLHITPGLRYTNDRKDARRVLQGGAVVDIPRQFKESRVDPALTVAYDVTPDINVYARYAQAYRAGGAGIRDPQFRAFGAEVNTAYELGFKSVLFDRRAIFNVAAFYNSVKDRQLTVQLSPTNPAVTATINAAGKTPVWGVELEATVMPATGLTLNATYAFQDSKFSGKALASLATQDPTGQFFIPNLPKHSGTFSIDYVTPDIGIGKIALHGDYTWAQKYASTIRVPTSNFAWPLKRDLANARVSLQDIPVGPAGLTISGYVKNVFDTAYPVFTTPSSNAILSPPRTYGIEATVRF